MNNKILFFTSSSCHPCKRIKKIIEDNNFLHELNIKIIDIELNFHIAKNMTVMKTPTFIKIDCNGKELKRHIGSLTLTQLKNF